MKYLTRAKCRNMKYQQVIGSFTNVVWSCSCRYHQIWNEKSCFSY